MNPRCRSLTALVVLGAFSVSCVSTQLPPISAVGPRFEPLPDELELWDEARQEQQRLAAEAPLFDDPELIDYLDSVVARLNPPAMAANRSLRYRVQVIEDPTLNAFAYPDGALYLHTGLLARLENEDQLATVLGHEMTHVEHRHMLRHRRVAHNRAVGLAVASVAAAVVLAGVEADALADGHWGRAATIDLVGELIVGLGLQLAFLAAVNGYGRELEQEADRGGFAKLRHAGYDLAAAPRVYEILADDHGEPSPAEGFFFGSHPKLAERRAGAVAEITRAPQATPPQPNNPEDFARRLRLVVREDARANIDLGRLKLAESELERALATLPRDPETHFQIGRLRLAQAAGATDEDEAASQRSEAQAALREAVRLDPERPAPHRELGRLLHRSRDFGAACIELRHYVELAPDAEDADRVRDDLVELESEGRCAD